MIGRSDTTGPLEVGSRELTCSNWESARHPAVSPGQNGHWRVLKPAWPEEAELFLGFGYGFEGLARRIIARSEASGNFAMESK